MSAKKVKVVKSHKVTDQIFTYDDGSKSYMVFYTVSYDEDYYKDDVNNLLHKCFKLEYTNIIASSAENAVRIAKEILPVRLKENAPYIFYRDKKNIKVNSIENVYVQTIHDREKL